MTGYCPVNAACLTILRCRLIRVREMTAARMSGRAGRLGAAPGRVDARNGGPGQGRRTQPQGRFGGVVEQHPRCGALPADSRTTRSAVRAAAPAAAWW